MKLRTGSAANRDLAQGLKNYLEETNKQIERLDQAFKKLGQEPSGTDCPAIDGLNDNQRTRVAESKMRPSCPT
jgi:ferritin-like metal-binding protein YciE